MLSSSFPSMRVFHPFVFVRLLLDNYSYDSRKVLERRVRETLQPQDVCESGNGEVSQHLQVR